VSGPKSRAAASIRCSETSPLSTSFTTPGPGPPPSPGSQSALHSPLPSHSGRSEYICSRRHYALEPPLPLEFQGGYEGGLECPGGAWRTLGGRGGQTVPRKTFRVPSCGTDPGGGFERHFLLPPAEPRRRPRRFTSRGKSLVALTLSLWGRRLQGAGPPLGGASDGLGGLSRRVSGARGSKA
jgi:hypothetical protein